MKPSHVSATVLLLLTALAAGLTLASGNVTPKGATAAPQPISPSLCDEVAEELIIHVQRGMMDEERARQIIVRCYDKFGNQPRS